jgi:transcriptional regulator with XRE-family HTH domain
MTTAAVLVQEARAEAGLSVRALAARAGVPPSTVSRIERGEMDPTLTMLRRVLGGASKRLRLDKAPLGRRPSIAALAVAAPPPDRRFRSDWTALRGFADWARRHPDDLASAVEDPPARTGTPFDAILASFTEELCRTYEIDPPRWTADVPALEDRWEPPGTPRMLEQARKNTPPSFRFRNLTLARSDLFRDDEAA